MDALKALANERDVPYQSLVNRIPMALPLFTITAFLSAFLLFSVQPMFAKMVLPMLGGTPAVWNTCLVFFQVALLGGYGYAHVTTARFGVQRQAALHVALLVLTLFALPIGLPRGWRPPNEANPIPWLLGLLLVTVGLPFFVVSTSAPLLQKWFANTGHPAARDPYFLYAASNLGSLLALLSYPVVVEPKLRLVDQSLAWACGYGLLVALTFRCARTLWRSGRSEAQGQSPGTGPASPPLSSRAEPGVGVPISRRVWWVMLSFVPSSLMLGVTTYLSTDIAAVPLLWVIPLAIYLLTFVLAFARRSLVPHSFTVRALPPVVLCLTILIVSKQTKPVWLMMSLHLLMFFVAAMVCHGELAKDRPPARSLTEFYLWLAGGGALGGLFNALVAPMIFDTFLEYPLAMVLACLLRPGLSPHSPRPPSHWLDYAMPAALGALVAGFALSLQVISVTPERLRVLLLCGPPALLCYSFRYRPVRFGLGIGAFLLVGLFVTTDWEHVVNLKRSFFGVYKVLRVGRYHELMHGTTLHGLQSLDPARRREPLTYYHPTGPLGQLIDTFAGDVPRLHNVAVIGLGTGSMGCYASPRQRWTFYEIDPTVKRIATNPRYFTLLQDCLETFEIVLGDARLSLARAPARHYDLIAIDAFSSDAIPVHLLTREAIRLYLAKLAAGGLVTFHVSNRYLALEPVLGDLAMAEDLVCLARKDHDVSEAQEAGGKTSSDWVVLARQLTDLGELTSDPRWRLVPGRRDSTVWTDDFSNLLGVFQWR